MIWASKLKVAIISDLHLGSKWESERQQDPFDQARDAFDSALGLGAELILVPGDIFDDRIPRQEVWAHAMRILSLTQGKEGSGLKFIDTIGKDEKEIPKALFRGVPIIAVHGNHERRSVDLVDPIEMLEAAGLVIRLNRGVVLLDTPAGKVAIHGIGYVPEEHIGDVVEIWNPRPIEDAFNVLMIHQSLGQFVHSEKEEPALTPETLPEGFDLYICGHVHYHSETEARGSPLLFPGSTFRTQLLPIEAEVPKGFFMLDLGDSELSYEFEKLGSVRDFYYEEKTFNRATVAQIESWIENKIEEKLKDQRKNTEKLPIVRFRLQGSLAKGSARSHLNVEELKKKFAEKILLEISKHELTSPELEEKTKFLKDLSEKQVPIEEIAMEILMSNLKEMNYDGVFDVRALYELLSENKGDRAFNMVSDVIDKLTESELGE
ncbi:hypothetical protein AKJ43_00855 [candidate division MSBL1 archaeon SCGC-AAA261D19]|uniref:Calcineurin-like phosphoesterase domain-containing protein n=1 Tax=candidate division MSBL1 archaeon SCGC-AAA261D19 TaxID=1698273 RepID=A0A133V8D5_9EURY|nr:hypothetical protein AKJ43_00855 [candidate division MSBL1 archaeon SCGC-AAA261D19]